MTDRLYLGGRPVDTERDSLEYTYGGGAQPATRTAAGGTTTQVGPAYVSAIRAGLVPASETEEDDLLALLGQPGIVPLKTPDEVVYPVRLEEARVLGFTENLTRTYEATWQVVPHVAVAERFGPLFSSLGTWAYSPLASAPWTLVGSPVAGADAIELTGAGAWNTRGLWEPSASRGTREQPSLEAEVTIAAAGRTSLVLENTVSSLENLAGGVSGVGVVFNGTTITTVAGGVISSDTYAPGVYAGTYRVQVTARPGGARVVVWKDGLVVYRRVAVVWAWSAAVVLGAAWRVHTGAVSLHSLAVQRG